MAAAEEADALVVGEALMGWFAFQGFDNACLQSRIYDENPHLKQRPSYHGYSTFTPDPFSNAVPSSCSNHLLDPFVLAEKGFNSQWDISCFYHLRSRVALK